MFSLGHITVYVDPLIVKPYNIRRVLVCLCSSYMGLRCAAWLLALRNNFTSHLDTPSISAPCENPVGYRYLQLTPRVESTQHIPESRVRPLADYARCPPPAPRRGHHGNGARLPVKS